VVVVVLVVVLMGLSGSGSSRFGARGSDMVMVVLVGLKCWW